MFFLVIFFEKKLEMHVLSRQSMQLGLGGDGVTRLTPTLIMTLSSKNVFASVCAGSTYSLAVANFDPAYDFCGEGFRLGTTVLSPS